MLRIKMILVKVTAMNLVKITEMELLRIKMNMVKITEVELVKITEMDLEKKLLLRPIKLAKMVSGLI